MHRSGTSAVTRLIALLGVPTPAGGDLVPPSAKNPTGFWESMSLVAFNARVLAALDSDMSCPRIFETGWESDPRLDDLRGEAPLAFRHVFPSDPWVWKDPRNCLALSFWLEALQMRPAVVLVCRNPLEIVASSLRSREGEGKIYALALWERYLREAIGQIRGMPVMVTTYEEVLDDARGWCVRTAAFLDREGIDVRVEREKEVAAFVERGLRHVEFTREEFLHDRDVSDAQRQLFLALEGLAGCHGQFVPPELPSESPTTEALLAERRRALQIKRDLHLALELERRNKWWSRVARLAHAV
jgi:hypothetical protein